MSLWVKGNFILCVHIHVTAESDTATGADAGKVPQQYRLKAMLAQGLLPFPLCPSPSLSKRLCKFAQFFKFHTMGMGLQSTPSQPTRACHHLHKWKCFHDPNAFLGFWLRSTFRNKTQVDFSSDFSDFILHTTVHGSRKERSFGKHGEKNNDWGKILT